MIDFNIFPYQEDGIQKELKMKRVLNGDSPGLGKSMQSIIAIERARATPCLVICPSALKINWEREIKKFTNLRPLILTDSVKSTFPYYIGNLNIYDVIITNYESLRKYFIVTMGERPYKLKNFVFQNVVSQLKSVIIDESARVKDPGAQQSKIVMGICQNKEYIIELTGTPVVNDPMDIATQIAILGRINEFGSFGEFMNRYGSGDNLIELNRKLNELCYFRREKEDVLDDLPDLTRTTIETEMDAKTQEEYNLCLMDLRSFLVEYKNLTDSEAKKKMRMKALVQFMNLRAISGRGKLEAAKQFLNDLGTACVVFCEHKTIVSELKQAFSNDSVTVTGNDNAMMKQYAIDAFQSGKKRIIICSIKAAGVGLTLTKGSHELFVELPWTFADLDQCECRCRRIGQKSAVNSWIMMSKDSIDERLYDLIMSKRSLAAKITGSLDAAFEDEKTFDEFMNIALSDNINNKN